MLKVQLQILRKVRPFLWQVLLFQTKIYLAFPFLRKWAYFLSQAKLRYFLDCITSDRAKHFIFIGFIVLLEIQVFLHSPRPYQYSLLDNWQNQ